MKNYNHIVLLILFFFSFTIFSQTQNSPKNKEKRPITIVIDPNHLPKDSKNKNLILKFGINEYVEKDPKKMDKGLKAEILDLDQNGFLYDNSLEDNSKNNTSQDIPHRTNPQVIILKTEGSAKQAVVNHYHYYLNGDQKSHNNNNFQNKKKLDTNNKKQKRREYKEEKENYNVLDDVLTNSATKQAQPRKFQSSKIKRRSGLDVIKSYQSDRKKQKNLMFQRRKNMYMKKQNQMMNLLPTNNGVINPVYKSNNYNEPFRNPYKQDKPGKYDYPHQDFFRTNNPYPHEVKDKKRKYYHYNQ